jgi:AcrR family transcriptional regulator
MTTLPTPPKPPRYHHGDLRSALIEAAERLMHDQGSWNFTLREVARAAGVSHNAPYNHFADKQALLATIATRAFGALGAALDKATGAPGEASIVARIEAAAVAYVAFAVEQPARFRLMFSADLAQCDDPDLTTAAKGSFGVLETLIATGVASGDLRADPHATHALAAWSLVHGLSSLIIDGRAAKGAQGTAVQSIAGLVGKTLIDGLVDGADDPATTALR